MPQPRLSLTAAWDILPNGAVPVPISPYDPTISAERPGEPLQRVADLLDGDEKPAPVVRPDVSRPGRFEYSRGGIIATRDFAFTITEQGDGGFAVYRAKDQIQLAAGRIGPDGTALVLLNPAGQGEKHVPGEQSASSGLQAVWYPIHHHRITALI